MYFYVVVRADSQLINLVSLSEPLQVIIVTTSFCSCRDIYQSLANGKNADMKRYRTADCAWYGVNGVLCAKVLCPN
jgi:hypothetical protein